MVPSISAVFGQGQAFTKYLPPCVRTGGTGSCLHQMEQVHELSSSERNSSVVSRELTNGKLGSVLACGESFAV